MNFKQIEEVSTQSYLAGAQGIVVFVESSDDEFIFKKWFKPLLENIQFASVSGRKADGGCNAVMNRVKEADYYYGIVDRDALFNHLEHHEALWWQVDDEAFYAEKPFGDHIFVLNRWEMENYLLHPEAIKQRVNNRTMGKHQYSVEQLADYFINEEDNFIAVTVLSTLGNGQRRERYAKHESGESLWHQVQLKIEHDKLHLTEEHKQKIHAFAENQTEPLRRWERLSRMLDGKRVMHRIDEMLHHLGVNKDFCLKNEKGDLADSLFNQGLIDHALQAWLNSIVSPRRNSH